MPMKPDLERSRQLHEQLQQERRMLTIVMMSGADREQLHEDFWNAHSEAEFASAYHTYEFQLEGTSLFAIAAVVVVKYEQEE